MWVVLCRVEAGLFCINPYCLSPFHKAILFSDLGFQAERLWKLTKKQCLASQYYENFAAFKGAIAGF